MRTITLILTLASVHSYGQLASIGGTIFSITDSSKVFMATVKIEGTNIGSLSDFEGQNKIDNIKAGTYDIVAFGPMMEEYKISSLNVHDGETISLNIGMNPVICLDKSPKSCPIDGNTKDVIRVENGLGNRRMNKKAEKGKLWIRGCLWSGCELFWHCERHNHEY